MWRGELNERICIAKTVDVQPRMMFADHGEELRGLQVEELTGLV